MTNIKVRIENAKKVITGNESLLDMLDADGATAMLNWGMELAGKIAQSTEGMDDSSAEMNMEPRLKALRQFMRAVGNWAAGKYADAASRVQLKEKLLEYLKTMNIVDMEFSSIGELDKQVDLGGNKQLRSIVAIKELFVKSR